MRKTIAAARIAAFVIALAPVHKVLADQNRAIAFATNIWPNVNYLDKSSRLAMSKSPSGAIRGFARSEASDQTIAANSLVAWMDSVISQPAKSSSRSVPGSFAALPFRAAAEVSSSMADEIDGMQTGRSVAIDDEPAPPSPTIRLKEIRLPSATANIDRLAGLSGAQFDALYKTTQIDALTQLSTIYATYIQDGQDPGLRNFAVRQLPKIDTALSTLRALR